MQLSRTAVVTVLLLASFAACRKSDNAAAVDTSATFGSTTSPATADTAVPAPDTQADPEIMNLSDENIVAKLEEGDSKEVALSKSFASKASNQDLKNYLAMLATDHSKALNDMKETAKKAKLAATPPAGDTSKKELADLEDRFQKLAKGIDFDSAFVNYAIQDHKKDIADSRAMQQQAKSQELKDAIGKDFPVLQKHLDKAQELSGKIR